MTCTADVICRPVEWQWRDRVPRGMLTLFAGDPKLGKSFVTVAMTAAVSRGVALPGGDQPDGPGNVVMLSAEDDPARTIVPRLQAAGAVRSRVHLLESVYRGDETEALPSLRFDIDAIEQAVTRLGDCRLIIIDPVSAYLDGIDDHRNAELRGVLSPLKALAERTNAAVVLVTHLNKGAGTNGKHRVIASIAYVGACRANFLFVRDRDDPTGRRVLMLDNGCNLVASVPTLAYVIGDHGQGSVVEWETEPVDVTAEQALAAEAVDPHERNERAECDQWLREMLADGRKLQREIVKGGRDAGFGEKALNRAKWRIGARSKRVGFGRDSKCYWTLGTSAHGGPEPSIDSP
jgi:RecA-family ATPase